MPLSAGVVRNQEGKVALGAIVNFSQVSGKGKALTALVGKLPWKRHQGPWFLWHRCGARLGVSDKWGTWSLSCLCSGQCPVPSQPGNGFCRAGLASPFLQETQLPQPSHLCGSHTLKARGDSSIVLMLISLASTILPFPSDSISMREMEFCGCAAC